MLQVLSEHGFVPDRIYGCSVGAVNGTAFAADPSRAWVEHMSEVWLALDRDSIYPQGRLHGPWMYIQQRDSVYPNTGLRRIIEDGVPYARLEDAQIPVEVVATSLADGGEHWFTSGPVVETVLASSAVPAIFPPVEINGERYIDGGVVDNVPIRRALDAGATRIVVLLCTPPTFTPVLPKRPAEAILNALWISVHSRFPQDLMQLPAGVEVIVCCGSEPGDRDFNDFSTTDELIAEGRREAEEIVARYGLGTPESTVLARPDEVRVGAPSAASAADHDDDTPPRRIPSNTSPRTSRQTTGQTTGRTSRQTTGETSRRATWQTTCPRACGSRAAPGCVSRAAPASGPGRCSTGATCGPSGQRRRTPGRTTSTVQRRAALVPPISAPDRPPPGRPPPGPPPERPDSERTDSERTDSDHRV